MAGTVQLPATFLILHALKSEDMFNVLPGWTVGSSWILATISYALIYLSGGVVFVLGKFTPEEYTPIPNLSANSQPAQ
jgi:hypothetical protein